MNKCIVLCLFPTIILQVAYTEISTNPYIEALKLHPWKSVQKYVEVRPGAFIFYWLYYADGTDVDADKKPLLIWIQGGPGLAATGVANFEEIGPLDANWQPRNHTWVKGRNLLLIDHPVGTGFSYVEDESLIVKTDEEIANDLKTTINGFFNNHKEFRETPAFILGQSYGGKITPQLAYYLHLDIAAKSMSMNLKGIGIGSGWVHPGESTKVKPDIFYSMGAIDRKSYLRLSRMSQELYQLTDDKNFGHIQGDYQSYEEFRKYLIKATGPGYIHFYNTNQEFFGYYEKMIILPKIVNQYVKPTLAHVVNQSLEWNVMSDSVFYALNKTFLTPSTKFVELLLNQTNIKIAVYNGNLDAVTPIAGASNWVHKLQWHGAESFSNSARNSIRGHRNGFYKTAGKLSFWSVFGAGHWVPEDNPTAMHHILDYLTEEKKYKNEISAALLQFLLQYL